MSTFMMIGYGNSLLLHSTFIIHNGVKVNRAPFNNYVDKVRGMAIQVVEFSNGGYKIRKIFA